MSREVQDRATSLIKLPSVDCAKYSCSENYEVAVGLL